MSVMLTSKGVAVFTYIMMQESVRIDDVKAYGIFKVGVVDKESNFSSHEGI